MMRTKVMTVSHSFPEILVPLLTLPISFHAFDHSIIFHGLTLLYSPNLPFFPSYRKYSK